MTIAQLAQTIAAPPPPVAGKWTFYADRILDGAPLGLVQPVAASYTQTLSNFGTGMVRLPVGGIALASNDLLALWTWRLWFIYDGTPMWCGVPSGVVDEGAAVVALTLTELSGYLTKRAMDQVKNYSQVEQTAIAADLAAPLGDVGVAIVTDPGPGVRRDRSYAYLEGQSRAELLANLAIVLSGPEFRTEYGMNSFTGRPAATLRVAYPRVGQPGNLAVAVPGNALTYRATWDSDQYRTRTFAVGDVSADAPQGTPKPVVAVDAPPQPNTPRIDGVDDWPGVVLSATLNDYAQSHSAIYSTPPLGIEASTFESDPKLGSYGLGDDIAVGVSDPLLDGYATTGRLQAVAVDCATGKVTWTVAMVIPPARHRTSLSGAINKMQSGNARMYRSNVDSTGAAP